MAGAQLVRPVKQYSLTHFSENFHLDQYSLIKHSHSLIKQSNYPIVQYNDTDFSIMVGGKYFVDLCVTKCRCIWKDVSGDKGVFDSLEWKLVFVFSFESID